MLNISGPGRCPVCDTEVAETEPRVQLQTTRDWVCNECGKREGEAMIQAMQKRDAIEGARPLTDAERNAIVRLNM